MFIRALAVLLSCAILAGCQMVIPPAASDPIPQLDAPIVLAVGESATMQDPVLENTIDLTFEGVREDTRCPKSTTSDVMCAWSGAVEVEMTAVVDGETETFPLIGVTDYDGVVEGSIIAETDSTIWYFAGYHFVLERVTPYPTGADRPLPETYETTVVVRRVAEPLPTPTEPAASIDHLIDESGLPVLCVSEMAIAEWAAGATEDEPFRLSPPIAGESLPSVDAADEVCAVVYGEGWRMADTWDLGGIWSEFAPADGAHWIGDSDNDAVVER